MRTKDAIKRGRGFSKPFRVKTAAIKHVMSGVNPQGCQVYSFIFCGAV
jgi:hypothetical protein